jgi:hypothetical protein
MPDLNLDRLAHLVTTHPLASVVAALLLGWPFRYLSGGTSCV